MRQPSKEQIIEALEKSGYLFEQDVATLLKNLEFHVETDYACTDLDEDKSWEIDVRAIQLSAVLQFTRCCGHSTAREVAWHLN